MKRYFFYVLLFPPALMNLLLVQMQPSDLLRYALAGYVVAAFPAIGIALTDEMLARASVAKRAAWCGLVGFALSPVALWVFGSSGIWTSVQAACCGGVAAFLCATVFARLNRKPAPRHQVSTATQP
jgi:hypothetical protein